RKPGQPAAVSGPGKLSKRTDGNPDRGLPANGDYGYRKETREQMSAAPMAQNFQPTPTASVSIPSAPTPITGMFAPTERPDEPVTSGSPMGFGPGPETLNLPQTTFNPVQALSRIAANDPSGQVANILQDLSSRGIQ
ncbi:hypothetical protein EBS02_06455, partial [bacterium]|nr:hypothetical protein [bacterium]